MSRLILTENVKAGANMLCDWCGEELEAGYVYSRNTWEDGDRTWIERFHLECDEAATNWAYGDYIPKQMKRGLKAINE